MNYKQILEQAQLYGCAGEQQRKYAAKRMSDDLMAVEKIDSELYRRILYNQHAVFFGRHYSECMANFVVNAMEYVDMKEEKCGAHWSYAEIEELTGGMKFHPKVNVWDKYVAYNAMYAVLCTDMEEEEIKKAAYRFYFCDVTWQTDDDCTKVWDSMMQK